MKATTIYFVHVVTAQRRQIKLCLLGGPPTKDDLVAAIAAEITALQKQAEEYDLEDDEDGSYEHLSDKANAEIEDLGFIMEVAAHATWVARNEWANQTLPVTIAGTQIGEIRVEELKAYKK